MANGLIQRIALVGFGEVGGILGRDFAKQGIDVSVWDILLRSKKTRGAMLANARDCGVRTTESLRECLHDAGLVISAVTASSAASVAREAAPLLRAGQFFLDINSVRPRRSAPRRAESRKGRGTLSRRR